MHATVCTVIRLCRGTCEEHGLQVGAGGHLHEVDGGDGIVQHLRARELEHFARHHCIRTHMPSGVSAEVSGENKR